MTARRLHLLEVGLHWPPEPYLRWKLERLAAQGMRVTVASTVPRRRAHDRLAGVELQCVPSWREPRVSKALGLVRDSLSLAASDPRRLRTLVAAVRRPRDAREATPWPVALGRLRRFLRLARLRPDVVHFEWPTAAVSHLPLLEVWDCPVVVSCHENAGTWVRAPGNERWRDGLPLTFAAAAAVHCVSEATRGQNVEHGVDPAKTRLIRPAVDTDLFRPSSNGGSPNGRVGVVAVGRLDWVKGHEYALQAIRLLLDRGLAVHLNLVGQGPERERLEATIDDLELSEAVVLHGWLPTAAVSGLLERADVFVNASVSEGMPTAILEAMATGVPVVATDCGGTREAVRDGREGIVVPPRDPRAMADAIERLATSAALRARMGRAGSVRARAEFAIDDQVTRFRELYEELAEGGGPQR